MTEKLLKATVKPETTIIIFLTRPSSFLPREKELIEQLKTIYLHFELHAFYGDVLMLKNAESRVKFCLNLQQNIDLKIVIGNIN